MGCLIDYQVMTHEIHAHSLKVAFFFKELESQTQLAAVPKKRS